MPVRACHVTIVSSCLVTTVASLLALKLNVDEGCFSFKPPKALLEINKSVVRQYNEEHGSY